MTDCSLDLQICYKTYSAIKVRTSTMISSKNLLCSLFLWFLNNLWIKDGKWKRLENIFDLDTPLSYHFVSFFPIPGVLEVEKQKETPRSGEKKKECKME